jgi:uncharacterized protein (UPF0262 family)
MIPGRSKLARQLGFEGSNLRKKRLQNDVENEWWTNLRTMTMIYLLWWIFHIVTGE